MLHFTFSTLFTSILIIHISAQIMQHSETSAQQSQQNSFEFQGFKLNRPLPLSFAAGQIYLVQGKIDFSLQQFNGSFIGFYISVQFKDMDNKTNSFYSQSYSQEKDLTFNVSCLMANKGNFSVSIYSLFDQENQQNNIKFTSQQLRSVIDIPSSQQLMPNSDLIPQKVEVKAEQDEWYIRWASKSALTNITFYQIPTNGVLIKKQFILSGYHSYLSPPAIQFIDFKSTPTYIQLSHANSQDGTYLKQSQKFNKQVVVLQIKVTNSFLTIYPEIYNAQPKLPYRMKINETLSCILTFYQRIKSYYFIRFTNGTKSKLSQLYFSKASGNVRGSVNNGFPVKVFLRFDVVGNYQIQVPALSNGYIYFTHTIIVGDAIPMLPQQLNPYSYQFLTPYNQTTYLDKYIKKTLNTSIEAPKIESTLAQKREYQMEMLNRIRKMYEINEVKADNKLNQLAQYQASMLSTQWNIDSEDTMVSKLNITYKLTSIHYFFTSLNQFNYFIMQSLSYLSIAINKTSIAVGIGIIQTNNSDTNKTYAIVYYFGARNIFKQPLTMAQYDKMQQKLLKTIKDNNPNIIKQSKTLSKDISIWVNLTANSVVQAKDLQQYLEAKKIYGNAVSVQTLNLNYYDTELEDVKSNASLENIWGTQVGLALKMNKYNQKLTQLTPITAFIVYI